MSDVAPGYQPFAATIRRILSLSPQQHAVLREAIFSAQSFRRSYSRSRQLSDSLGPEFDANDAFSILATLAWFYDQARAWERSTGLDSVTAMNQLLEFFGVGKELFLGGSEGGLERILELTAPNPQYDSVRKAYRLRTGFVPTASEFSSFLDLRPRFSEDRLLVEDLVPVALFQVVTYSEHEGQKSILFQITSSAVKRLKKAVEDLESKLAAVRSDPAIGPRLRAREDDETDSNGEPES